MADVGTRIDQLDANVQKVAALAGGIISLVSLVVGAVKKAHAGVDPGQELDAALASLSAQRDELGAAIADFRSKYPTEPSA